MVEYLLGCSMCGLFNILAVSGLIRQMKRLDTESDLPDGIKIKEYIMFFLCGAVSYQGIAIITIVMFGLAVYLSFMAYTDHHTQKVYSFYSYMFLVAGVSTMLLMTENLKMALICYLIFGGVVLLGFLFHAYAFGDVEIYMALYPYIMQFVFTDIAIEDRFMHLITWFLLTLFITVVTSINIKEFKFNKTKALAPAIAFSFAVLCVCRYL